MHRLSAVAHRVEDLIGRLRDGLVQPSAEIVDLLLQSVDVLKNFLHRSWPDDDQMAASVGPLLARIAELAPEEAGTALRRGRRKRRRPSKRRNPPRPLPSLLAPFRALRRQNRFASRSTGSIA